VAGGVSCTASLPLLTKRAIAAAALRR
jgi:hypothetical protein